MVVKNLAQQQGQFTNKSIANILMIHKKRRGIT